MISLIDIWGFKSTENQVGMYKDCVHDLFWMKCERFMQKWSGSNWSTLQTYCHPSYPPLLIRCMMSCDIMWCHRHDIALPPLHSWSLILLFQCQEFVTFDGHDPHHPYMTHPTHKWPTPHHPYMTQPTPTYMTPTRTHPLVSIHEFLKPYELLFLEFESFINGWMWIGKKLLNDLSGTCHSLNNFLPLIHIPSYPFVNFQNLQVIISQVWVIHQKLNVNCIKIHSIILSVTCHGLTNFPPLIYIPLYPLVSIHEFSKLQVIISWVGVIHKMLDVNWKKFTQ